MSWERDRPPRSHLFSLAYIIIERAAARLAIYEGIDRIYVTLVILLVQPNRPLTSCRRVSVRERTVITITRVAIRATWETKREFIIIIISLRATILYFPVSVNSRLRRILEKGKEKKERKKDKREPIIFARL